MDLFKKGCKGLLILAFCLFSYLAIGQESEPNEQLDWPDTTSWVVHELDDVMPNLVMKAPATFPFYAFPDYISIPANKEMVVIVERVGKHNDFDIEEHREWLNKYPNPHRKWIINDEQFGYYTTPNPDSTSSVKTIHTFFGCVTVGKRQYSVTAPGLEIHNGITYSLSQLQVLGLITVLRSMKLVK